MDVINAALGKYERIYEEKFPTVPVVEVIDRRPKKAVAVNGSIHYLTEDEMQDVGQSETDLAVAAAFALMKEVNSRHIDAPATPKKSGTPKKGGSLRDINKVGGSLKDLSRGLDSANGNRVADSAKVKNVSDVESGEDEDEYKEPPLLDVKLRPRKLSTKIAEQATKLTEQERRKSLIVMEGQPHVNRDDKGDRLKNILGDLLSLTRTGELSEAELGAEHVGLVKGGGSGSNPHLLSTSSRLSPDRGHTSDSLRPNSRVSGRSRMSLNQSDAME
ncbi:hypothetical protein BCR33DRAFT_738433 [Rhizoclosmatium globosum]|uniref:Uncharacterized protein n=1 Tax=Rhizoclosmatium globosum TaxID=329046 RepID=A0A1Y2C9V8_9FUNG|nr:hypothetical protein BCR33DRAFT_738433 [Rhizoclosmatium globosum]|eukprot:ORY43687.1 hypothetical protein BCR33DRAFT_738433 [Rhizoclosmatium globosum]